MGLELNPRYQINFDASTHTYTVEGQPATPVTALLEGLGLSDPASYYGHATLNRGRAVHQICGLLAEAVPARSPQELIQASQWDPDSTSPELVPYGKACAAFFCEHGFLQTRPELVVGSPLWRVAGTADALALMRNGQLALVEFKSGTARPSAVIQAGIYALLVEECYGLPVQQIFVVELSRDGRYSLAWQEMLASARGLAQSALNLHAWKQRYR